MCEHTSVYRHFQWNQCAIFTATGVHAEAGLHFTTELKRAGFAVVRLTPFEAYNFEPAALSALRRTGVRVVMLVASSGDTRAVGNSGISLEGSWAWITFERRNAVTGMQGWLFIQALLLSEGMQTFAEQVSAHSKAHFNLTVSSDSVDLTYGAALYDAIM